MNTTSNLRYARSIAKLVKIGEDRRFQLGVERIKRKGSISKVKVTNETIVKNIDGYRAMATIRADGVPINYTSEIFKSRNELEEHIDFVFNNPRLIAGEYLGVM